MVQDVRIEIDVNTLERRKNITGTICFMFNYHHYFPDQDWSDFVVRILSWGIKSCKGLMVSEVGRSYEFDFMDGTPIVFAKKIDDKHVEMSFCEGGSLKAEFSGLFTIQQLRESLLSASKKVIRTTDRNKWVSRDIDDLKDLLLSLEKYPL
ncbi:hypothetical protein [Bacillus sp. KH172YL63]|uniref:hypothetical protein n=1 Tax=Bacillus sp. KH172YL63 TaxID=2709784 RepID=UPI0013E4FD5F|nr:hypothetical protein [Bacillus sp. KH172YL63]BCB05830.1 hypothetical protein KH172YL63_39630 [Bacillus sp. KH172YL63]